MEKRITKPQSGTMMRGIIRRQRAMAVGCIKLVLLLAFEDHDHVPGLSMVLIRIEGGNEFPPLSAILIDALIHDGRVHFAAGEPAARFQFVDVVFKAFHGNGPFGISKVSSVFRPSTNLFSNS